MSNITININIPAEAEGVGAERVAYSAATAPSELPPLAAEPFDAAPPPLLVPDLDVEAESAPPPDISVAELSADSDPATAPMLLTELVAALPETSGGSPMPMEIDDLLAAEGAPSSQEEAPQPPKAVARGRKS